MVPINGKIIKQVSNSSKSWQVIECTTLNVATSDISTKHTYRFKLEWTVFKCATMNVAASEQQLREKGEIFSAPQRCHFLWENSSCSWKPNQLTNWSSRSFSSDNSLWLSDHLQQFKGQKGNLRLQQRRLRENDGKGWGHRK